MFFFRRLSPSAAPTPISDAPAWLAPADEATAWNGAARMKPPVRLAPLLKTGAAAVLLGLGAFSIGSEQGAVASDNAVVSTRLISLRAPIEGIATAADGGAGARETKGQTVVRISNPLFNEQRVVELRETLGRLRASQNNAETHRVALLALSADLKDRTAIHAKANADRLSGLEAEGSPATPSGSAPATWRSNLSIATPPCCSSRSRKTVFRTSNRRPRALSAVRRTRRADGRRALGRRAGRPLAFRHHAALPAAETRSTIIAQVAVDPAEVGGKAGDASCLIGRTARVLLPTTGGGVFDGLYRRFF
jgi:hypothetical protein